MKLPAKCPLCGETWTDAFKWIASLQVWFCLACHEVFKPETKSTDETSHYR